MKKRSKICEDAHASKLRLITILKWSTECSVHELYSNRRNVWQFSNFFIYQKINIVRNLKHTPKVAQMFHLKTLLFWDWSTEPSGRQLCSTGWKKTIFRDFDHGNYVLYGLAKKKELQIVGYVWRSE